MQYLSTEQKSPMLNEQEDIQFIKTQLINNLFCIVNLEKTTLLYFFLKAKCFLYGSAFSRCSEMEVPIIRQ